MQQALDLSVESCYANLAKENVIIYTSDSSLRISASDISSISVTSEITNADTLNDFSTPFKKVMFSLSNPSIDFDTMDVYLEKELGRKNLDVEYVLLHYTPDSLFMSSDNNQYSLSTFSNSTFLPRDQETRNEVWERFTGYSSKRNVRYAYFSVDYWCRCWLAFISLSHNCRTEGISRDQERFDQ